MAKQLPAHMKQWVDDYVKYGDTGGDFLRAVLTNDLKNACAHADETSQEFLFELVRYLYNHAPAGCWGSDLNVSNHIDRTRVQSAASQPVNPPAAPSAEGWVLMSNAKKYHYFRNGTSLCGRWQYFGSAHQPATGWVSSHDCTVCATKLLMAAKKTKETK